MVNRPGLAVNDLTCTHDLSAESLSDCLMSEADAKQGHAGLGRGLHESEADARLVGVARSGRG